MIVQIEVTQAHIDRGVREECYKCPVSLAIGDRLNESSFAEVFHEEVSIWGNDTGGYDDIPFPENVSRRIYVYDNEYIMFPFTFTLDIPQWALEVKS